MTISTVSTCPAWCEYHTVEDDITLHERRTAGERWDIILTLDEADGTTLDVGLPSDRGLSPSEALALGVALAEAAATVGQAERKAAL